MVINKLWKTPPKKRFLGTGLVQLFLSRDDFAWGMVFIKREICIECCLLSLQVEHCIWVKKTEEERRKYLQQLLSPYFIFVKPECV